MLPDNQWESRNGDFQIEDIDYIYPYLPQILKTRSGDKQFLNRRYAWQPMGKRKRPFQ